MRKCIRCGTNMAKCTKDKKGEVIGLQLLVYTDSGSRSLTVSSGDGWFTPTFFEDVQVAVCPNCGELSMYLNIDK